MLDWRQVYRLAVSETDPKLLWQLIHELEDLSVKRGQELTRNPNPEESRAIQSDLAHILTIKKERLGWPDPRSHNSHSKAG